MSEKETRKVGVETLISRDKFVGERESGHEASLLEPEDRGERAGKEDAFDCSKSDESFSKRRSRVADPFQSPLSLLLDTRDGVDRLEEVRPSGRILDIGVDE